MLVFDFDGVMTDNRVLVFEDGREAVLCSRGDGMGLDLLKKSGLPLAVISKEVNPVVSARCRKLKIPCEQGIDDKLGVLARITAEQGLTLADVAFMGNDVNDLACMTAAGVAIAPCRFPSAGAARRPLWLPPHAAASARCARSATCCSPSAPTPAKPGLPERGRRRAAYVPAR